MNLYLILLLFCPRFIKGFITRNGPITDENKAFMALAKKEWLLRLAKNLPQNILDRKWPACPYVCREASQLLEKYYAAHMSRVYRLKLTPERKRQLELKVLAEQLFKGIRKYYHYKLLTNIGFQIKRRATEQVYLNGL